MHNLVCTRLLQLCQCQPVPEEPGQRAYCILSNLLKDVQPGERRGVQVQQCAVPDAWPHSRGAE